jgi:hypothetical protein
MMRRIIALTMLILMASSVMAMAAQEQVGITEKATAVKQAAVSARITAIQKNQFKETVRSYFNPVLHGYGIGFTDQNYITARWQITQVRMLSTSQVRSTVQASTQENETDWDAVRERVRNALSSASTERRGRVRIEGTDYVLVNIVVSNDSLTADIRELPDYIACRDANTTAADCETNSAKVGDVSITKRTKPNQERAGEPNVWAGTMNYNSVAYTFVTFAYPR